MTAIYIDGQMVGCLLKGGEWSIVRGLKWFSNGVVTNEYVRRMKKRLGNVVGSWGRAVMIHDWRSKFLHDALQSLNVDRCGWDDR